MNEESILEIYRKSAKEKWLYPQLFDALKSAGVDRYEVNVPAHETTYVGGGESFLSPAPEGFQMLKVGVMFDEAGLKKAITRSQNKEINYEQFLIEIASAGIPFYRVDMKPRTITYHGQKRTDKLVEKVP